jgi:hypothetical protein
MTELLPGIQEKVIAFRSASADREADGFTASAAIDGKSESRNGWGFGAEVGKPHAIVFEAEEALGNDEVLLTFKLDRSMARIILSADSVSLAPPQLCPSGSCHQKSAQLCRSRKVREMRRKRRRFQPTSARSRRPWGRSMQSLLKKEELAAIKPVALPILRELVAEKRRQTHLMNKGTTSVPGNR